MKQRLHSFLRPRPGTLPLLPLPIGQSNYLVIQDSYAIPEWRDRLCLLMGGTAMYCGKFFQKHINDAVTRMVELENRDCFQDDQSSVQEVDGSVGSKK